MVKFSRLLSALCALGLAYVAGRTLEVSFVFALILTLLAIGILIVGWRDALA